MNNRFYFTQTCITCVNRVYWRISNWLWERDRIESMAPDKIILIPNQKIEWFLGLNHQKFGFIAFNHLFRIAFHSKLFAISFRKPNKFDWRHVSNTSCVLLFTGFRTHSHGIRCVCMYTGTLTTQSRYEREIKWHKSIGIVSFKRAVRLNGTIRRQANNFYSASSYLSHSYCDACWCSFVHIPRWIVAWAAWVKTWNSNQMLLRWIRWRFLKR